MKYIRFYILVLLSITWVSCDDFLTEMPETAVVEGEAMTDIKSAEEIVIGVYSCFKNSSLYSGDLVQATEIQTDLLYAAIGYSNQFGKFFRWEVNSNEGTLLSVYAGLYEIIARCNFFMDNAELVRNTLTTENDKKLINKYETDIRFRFSTNLLYCLRS